MANTLIGLPDELSANILMSNVGRTFCWQNFYDLVRVAVECAKKWSHSAQPFVASVSRVFRKNKFCKFCFLKNHSNDFCFALRDRNLKSSSLRKKNLSAAQVSLDSEEPTSNKDVDVYLCFNSLSGASKAKVVCGSLIVHALLDTGADACLINYSLAMKLSFPLEPVFSLS